MKPVVGQKYRLRNGARVEVTGRTVFKGMAIDMKTSVRVDVTTFFGKIIGTEGGRISWNADGCYGANYRGHQLDIVSHDTPQKRRKK